MPFFLGDNRLETIPEESLSNIQSPNVSHPVSPEVSQQGSPEPRRRQRHFAEPNGHIPNATGDDTNKIEVIHEETIHAEGTIRPNKTKDWALVQNAALVIDVKELKLGWVL